MNAVALPRSLTDLVPEKHLDIIGRADDILRSQNAPIDEYEHAIDVAQTLAELGLDYETLSAALLQNIQLDTESKSEIQSQLGSEIFDLVEGVCRLSYLREINPGHSDLPAAQAENLRKMLLAMARDVRVVLIKLADQLSRMRVIQKLSELEQQILAKETLDIYAPLANRLGIWQIKWELEDLAFRKLERDTYKTLASNLERKRIEREAMINQVLEVVRNGLHSQGIDAELKGRPKHIYSIWRKMQRKNLPFDELFDVQAVRVLVDTVTDCYTVLGIVHGEWKHIPQEFDDYIANPKENGYQSLHTAVVGPGGHALEVQIRTHEMHQFAEYGVAAHWLYKEQSRHDAGLHEEINWLRQMLEWKDDEQEAEDFIDRFKSEVFQERLYVLTPQGQVIDLPSHSTPVDFAYHIHTQVGHRCRGAKVNGKMASLTDQLSNGDKVEILTAKEGGPSRDWLNPHLGYIVSGRARSSIRQWFRLQDFEKNLSDGKQQLERELKRVGLQLADARSLPEIFNLHSDDDLYAAVGRGEVTVNQVINQLQPQILDKELPATVNRQAEVPTGDDIIVAGVGKLMTEIATCCNPVPYESIIGYITRGSGVRIHRQDCVNMLNLNEEQQQRKIQVSWANQPDSRYTVPIKIVAYDRNGLLSDITQVLAKEDVNVRAVNSYSDEEDNTAHMNIVTEITHLDQLMRVLQKVAQVPSVLEAVRGE